MRSLHVSAAICAWFSIGCILVIVLVIALPVRILACAYRVFFQPCFGNGRFVDLEFLDAQIDLYERSCFDNQARTPVHHIETRVIVDGVEAKVHVIHVPPKASKSHMHKKADRGLCNVLLVHGMAGSSLSFVHMLEPLSASFNVYAIDLPGFGRTHLPSELHPSSSQHTKHGREISADVYCRLIEQTMKVLGIPHAILVGHSFGGFICLRLAKQRPEIVQGLVLVNSAGLFSTLGGLGVYWGCVFKYSILNVGRLLGPFGLWLFAQILSSRSKEALYWCYLIAHPLGVGDRFVAERITLTPLTAHWNHPTFHLLKDAPCKVLMVYGVEDSIMPPHQGLIVQRIYPSKCDLLLVPGQGHNPCSSAADASKIATKIELVFARNGRELMDASTPCYAGLADTTPKILSGTPAGKQPHFTHVHVVRSSFHVTSTRMQIAAYYAELGKIHNVDVSDISPSDIERNGQEALRLVGAGHL